MIKILECISQIKHNKCLVSKCTLTRKHFLNVWCKIDQWVSRAGRFYKDCTEYFSCKGANQLFKSRSFFNSYQMLNNSLLPRVPKKKGLFKGQRGQVQGKRGHPERALKRVSDRPSLCQSKVEGVLWIT